MCKVTTKKHGSEIIGRTLTTVIQTFDFNEYVFMNPEDVFMTREISLNLYSNLFSPKIVSGYYWTDIFVND